MNLTTDHMDSRLKCCHFIKSKLRFSHFSYETVFSDFRKSKINGCRNSQHKSLQSCQIKVSGQCMDSNINNRKPKSNHLLITWIIVLIKILNKYIKF